MTAATALTDADILPLVQGGANKKATAVVLADYVYSKKFIETDFLVETHADLPDAAANTGKLAYVRTSTGTILLLSRKTRGFYRSNGTTWDADDLPYRTADTVYVDNTGHTVLTGDDVQECLGQADTAIAGKANGTMTITVGTTAPSSPSAGDIWIDTN
jgi:hypothetical protein